ncbi:hypothetical protein [Thermovibrio sp.]
MKRFLSALFSNFHYKLLAVAFALLLWLLAANKEIAEITVRLKVKPVPTGDYRVVDFRPRYFTLKLEGVRKELLTLRENGEFYYYLPKDLEVKGSWIKVKIKKDKIYLPIQSAKVKSVSPKYLEVKVEMLVRKAVPVRVVVSGLKRDFKVKAVPNYAVVYVPEEVAQFVNSVKTEKVDLSSVKPPAALFVKLVSPYKLDYPKVELFIEKGR